MSSNTTRPYKYIIIKFVNYPILRNRKMVWSEHMKDLLKAVVQRTVLASYPKTA